MILNKQVGVFLNFVHNKFKQYVTSIFQQKGYNITPEQFLLTDALWDNGILSQQQIADIMLKDKNSVVKLIDGLEKKGLVTREPDPQDRRQNLIKVTASAIEMKEDVTNIAMGAVNLIIKDIPKQELYFFIKVLAKMAENMTAEEDLVQLSQFGEAIAANAAAAGRENIEI